MSTQASALAAKSVVFQECLMVSSLDRALAVDLRSFVVTCSIYENILTSTMSGELILNDDAGLSRMLFGYEYVRIRFSVFDPALQRLRHYPEKQGDALVFRVVMQTDRQQTSVGTETYRLALVSPALYTSVSSRISRAYKGKKVEDIIRDILTADIKTSRPFIAESTEQSTNFTIPYYQPLRAIEFFTSRAITPEKRTTYFFYESLDGFRFQSLSKMILDGRAAWAANTVPTIRRYPAGLTDVRDDSRNLRAEVMDILQTFDILRLAKEGYFSSRVVGVDVLSGKYRDTVHSNGDATFLQKPRLNDASLYAANDSKNVYSPDAKVFVVPTTSISAADAAITGADPSVSENFIESTVDTRNRELLDLQTQCLRVKTSGAPNLNAGGVVYIDVPFPAGRSKEPRDPLRSGLHLIVAVKHVILNIEGTYQYETIIEACSDSISVNT